MTLLFRLFDLYVEFVVSHVREFAEDDTWRGLAIEGVFRFRGSWWACGTGRLVCYVAPRARFFTVYAWVYDAVIPTFFRGRESGDRMKVLLVGTRSRCAYE